MTPAKRTDLSELYIWSQIQYLDPDLEALDLEARCKTAKESTRRKRLVTGLVAIATVVGALAVRYFHVIARLMN